MDCYGKYHENFEDNYKIPKIISFVWLTNEQKPREMKEVDIKALQYLVKNPASAISDGSWEIALYINTENIINSINAVKELGIEVRNIYDEQYGLKYTHLIYPYGKFLPISIDVLKYDILLNHGGMILDLNFKLRSNIEYYFKNYDFVATNNPATNLSSPIVENSMIAAKPNHPIIYNLLDFIENKINTNDHIDVCHFGANGYANPITWLPLGIFFYEEANKDNNCDVILYENDLASYFYSWNFEMQGGKRAGERYNESWKPNTVMDSAIFHDIINHSCDAIGPKSYLDTFLYVSNHCLVEMSGIGLDDWDTSFTWVVNN